MNFQFSGLLGRGSDVNETLSVTDDGCPYGAGGNLPAGKLIRALRAVFEDGPTDRPVLIIADLPGSTWPATVVHIARNELGPVIHYAYRHISDGHYRVCRETVLSGPATDLDILRGQELYARQAEGFTDPGTADTSQPYFLDLLRRINDATS